MPDHRWPTAAALTTGRLVLEPLRTEHARAAAIAFDDPVLHRFTGGWPATVEELRHRYARLVTGRSPDNRQGWLNWVLRVHDTGELVGTVQATLTSADDGARTAALAWVVATGHQGRGLAVEAAGAIGRWLGSEHGVHHQVAHIDPGNVASATAARRLGMTPTPVLVDGEVEWRRSLSAPTRGS